MPQVSSESGPICQVLLGKIGSPPFPEEEEPALKGQALPKGTPPLAMEPVSYPTSPPCLLLSVHNRKPAFFLTYPTFFAEGSRWGSESWCPSLYPLAQAPFASPG